MVKYLKTNLQFLIITIIWLLTGLYARPLTYLIVPVTFLLLSKKGLDEMLFIGFFAMLIFSDSFYLSFAKDIKPYILLILSLSFFNNQKSFRPIPSITSPFVPFFIYAILVLVNSVTIGLSMQKTLSYILLYIVVPNYVMKIYRNEGAVFFKNLIFFTISVLIVGILFKYINPAVAISHGDRFQGIFGNPNGVAMFCVLMYLLFSVLDEYYPELFTRGEKILVYALLFISIIWSGARTSMMCMIIFWVFSRVQKKSTILGIILFIVVLVTYELITSNLIEIVKNLGMGKYFRLDTLDAGSGRIFAWRYAWEEIQKNFFFGRGFDYNQYLFFIPETQHRLNMLNHQGDVHNVYLGFWLDVGLIGLVLFLAAFIYTFYKANQKSALAFPIMYTMLFMGNYEPWLIASLNPYTIQFLIIVTILIYCKRPDNEVVPILKTK